MLWNERQRNKSVCIVAIGKLQTNQVGQDISTGTEYRRANYPIDPKL